MRLDEHVILRSPQITNPLGERELDLRGNGLTLLDEAPLSQLDDSFDVIDLTDNNLTAVEYFPLMKRLTTIIAHRNRLQRFSLSAALRVPNLHTFVADDNAFSSLEQLIVFAKLKHLQRVSLGGSNRVAQHEYFRPLMIFLCPNLKLINFQRVLQAERQASSSLRSTFEALIASASGAAAVSLTLAITEKSQRKRSRAAKSLTTAPGSATSVTSPPEGGDAAGGSESNIFDKISQLQQKIDDAQTEEEMSALMEEMEALQDALDRKRRRK